MAFCKVRLSDQLSCCLGSTLRVHAFLISLVGLFGLAMLVGCNSKGGDSNLAPQTELAKVNNEVITQADVDFAIARSFQNAAVASVDESLQKKILDSLIASKAMAQLITLEMSAADITQIKNLSRVYEEELFVKAYLQKNVTPEPVTAEMVQDYYQNHLEEFGEKAIRDFELLKAPANLDEVKRDQLLKNVTKISAESNWRQFSSSWAQQFGVVYQQGRSVPGLLDKTLEQKIAGLNKGATSEVFFIEGQLFLVRVTNISETQPKPLAEVSADIRKKLAPLMLREAVKKTSEEARNAVKVVLKASPQ